MKRFIIFFAIVIFSFPPQPTEAVYAVRDDRAIAEAIKQVAHQAQQIQLETKHLAQMDAGTAAANMATIQANVQQLQLLQQQMAGILFDYQNYQRQWDATYHGSSDYAGMSAEDYARQAIFMQQETEKKIQAVMRTSGLINAQTLSNANSLQELTNASQTAQGALAAAQAGNQIAALMTQQIMALSQMVATSNQAQMAHLEEQKQRETMSRENIQYQLSVD